MNEYYLIHNKIGDHLAQYKGGPAPTHKESFKELIFKFNEARTKMRREITKSKLRLIMMRYFNE